MDTENLEGRLAGVLGVLAGLDPQPGDDLAFVGGPRAQRRLARYRLPPKWEAHTRRIRNDTEPEAADRIITDLVRDWAAAAKVVVVASRDSGFAYVLSQVHRRGTPVFVLGEERTAVHLRAHVPVLDIRDPAEIEAAVRSVTAATAG